MQQSAPPEFIVRIDSPRDRCWSLDDRLEIRGVFLATEAEAAAIRNEPNRLVLVVQEHCKRNTILYANMALYGRVLDPERNDSANEIVLESFEVSAERSELPTAVPPQYGTLWNVCARLDLSRLTFDSASERSFLFLLRVELGDRISESNPLRVLFPPPEKRTAVHGALSYPVEHRLSADVFVIDGWAVRRDDPVEQVEVFAGELPIGSAEIGIMPGAESELFPFTEDPRHCCFTFALRRAEFLGLPDASTLAERTFPLRAKARFRSGAELLIDGPQFRWDPVADLNGFRAGELEAVRVAGEGLIEVAGWFVDDGFAPIELFLEGRKWRTTLRDVEWSERKDIASRFPQAARGASVGFTARFHPELLGRSPGLVRVSAESGPYRTMLGSKALWSELSARIDQLNGSPRFGRAAVASLLSRCGIRRSFSAPGQTAKQSEREERFLFVSHNLSAVEGAPRVLLSVVDGVLGSGVSADRILVASPKDGELRRAFESRGVAVKLFPQLEVFGQSWKRYHEGLAEAEEATELFAPNVVFANVIDSFWAVDLARRKRIRAFWLIHESVSAVRALQGLDPKLRTLFFLNLSRCPKVGFVAKKTAELFHRFVSDERSVVIPNGINIAPIDERRSSLSKGAARAQLEVGDAHVVSIVGTTTPRKGQDIFLREVARLRAMRPSLSLRCFIVGARAIPFLAELRSMSAELGLDDIVRFVPETSDVAPYFIASDAIVIASREESAPLVSLEAFAYERPLVSTSVFGLSEQLEHEQNALVFQANEDGALARSLLRLFDDEALRARLVANARRAVEDRFSIKRSVAGYLKEIASC